MKRIAAVALVIPIVLVLGMGNALATGGGATVESFPVGFELSTDTCSHLPDGASVTGTGTERSVTVVRVIGGVTMIINTTHASGTAVDQDGNTYVFQYSNEFRLFNSPSNQDVFTGLMTDHFSMTGPGPATLVNGFVARITASADFSSFSAQPISSRGDPITFPEGEEHCDPL